MSALVGVVADGGFGDGHMGGWGWGAAVVMTAMMGGLGWIIWSMMRGAASGRGGLPEDPVDVLRGRYARGEISTEEFEERVQTIKRTRADPVLTPTAGEARSGGRE